MTCDKLVAYRYFPDLKSLAQRIYDGVIWTSEAPVFDLVPMPISSHVKSCDLAHVLERDMAEILLKALQDRMPNSVLDIVTEEDGYGESIHRIRSLETVVNERFAEQVDAAFTVACERFSQASDVYRNLRASGRLVQKKWPHARSSPKLGVPKVCYVGRSLDGRWHVFPENLRTVNGTKDCSFSTEDGARTYIDNYVFPWEMRPTFPTPPTVSEPSGYEYGSGHST